MVGDKCCCCEWAVIASYRRDNKCPPSHLVPVVEGFPILLRFSPLCLKYSLNVSQPHLVPVVEGVGPAVLVQGPVGGVAQVTRQVEIVIELGLGSAPSARHAVGVEVRGVALTPTPEKNQDLLIIRVCACHEM